ncbi:hypothetical protein WDU94_012484 [Cyamophila willieti]
MYYDCKAPQTALQPPIPEVQPVERHTDRPSPRLPVVQIPPFDGAYDKFPAFISLYDAMVHTQPITGIEKFSYLRSLVTGSASNAIQGITFSDENYGIAYNALVTRFTNSRHAATPVPGLLQCPSTGIEEHLWRRPWDFLLLFMGLRYLDAQTRQAFENARAEKTNAPTYKDLLKFVEGRVTATELYQSSPSTSTSSKPKPSRPQQAKSFVASTPTNPPSAKPDNPTKHGCASCNQSHRLVECTRFLALSVSDRFNFLKSKKLCFACFGPHPRQDCKSRFACRTCSSRSHHTLLHQSQQPAPSAPPAPAVVTTATSTNQVLLGTAVVQILDAFGQAHNIRVLVDPGSMLTIMSASLASRLAFPQKPCNVQITVMGLASSSTSLSSEPTHQTFHVSSNPADVSLDEQLKRFWEIDNVKVDIPVSSDDLQCEEHFQTTHYRESDGTYVVRLPFRQQPPPDLDQGHMIITTKPSSYVMTHSGVVKDSTTTKVRVVFSPAEHASPAHPSLNDILFVGPKLQNDINDIMLSFRLHRVVLTADIKQMYRAIKLHPEDSAYQQILWRQDPEQPVQQYEITRVCFGVTSSPFHALRVIKQLIKDEGHRFPKTAQVLNDHIYVDDVVVGCDSIPEARDLRKQLSGLLAAGGFELRKWSSSHPKVLDDLSLDLLDNPHPMGGTQTRILGIQWDATEDVFSYHVSPIDTCITKRQVLSQIARIFDLPGFLGPVIVWMKILMQKLWLLGLGWDEPLPKALLADWNLFVQEFSSPKTLKIPRHVMDTYIHPPELIGFADASSIAYAAVVYLRVVCSDQRVLINLVRAKTRVAPVKPVTIPRLELTACHLLASVVESLEPLRKSLNIQTLHLFSDSMVALAWLKKPAHTLKTFVANRVDPIEEWPCQNPLSLSPDQVPELKPQPGVCAAVSVPSVDGSLLERFSSFPRAQRILAWCLRFKHNCQTPSSRLSGPLKATELRHSEVCMIKLTQQLHYSDVFRALETQSKLPHSLASLSPFVKDGCLRVGGRIDKSPLPYDSRHPYLLSSKSHISILIVRYYHAITLHGGPKLVQHLIQSKYYIPGLRNLTRRIVFQCVPCYRFNAKPRQPYMAKFSPLPL